MLAYLVHLIVSISVKFTLLFSQFVRKGRCNNGEFPVRMTLILLDTHTRTHANMHTHTNTREHTRIHKHTNTHTQTYAHTRTEWSSCC
jgi:hypothetical protein